MTAVGRISGLYGARGEVSLTLYDTFFDFFPREALSRETIIEGPVFVVIDELRVPLFFENERAGERAGFRLRGVRGATVRFADIDTEARAAELVGLELFVDGGGGGDSDDGDFDALVGWEVDLGNGSTGVVVDFFDGENPLFEVEVSGGETVLIPAALVIEVDEDARKIFFELPEGLLDL